MADIENGHYDNSHRAFVQAFMARSVLTFDQARPILAHIQSVHDGRETLPGDVTEADFNAYITTANNALSPYDYEIRSTFSQHDRTRIYALVNTTSDPATQLATLHTADEIAFLKRVLDAMFETNNTALREVMAVTSMQALQLHKNPSAGQTQNGGATQGSTGPGLTMAQAEKMLKDLVEEGWFELSKKGYYSLTPRALIELRGWLLQTYNELDDEDEGEQEQHVERIKLCQACKEIVTIVGYIRSNVTCWDLTDDHRDNVAPIANVRVDYTTSALGTFSG
ncbi:hypothetical protein B0A49_10048 [Cryomyces minteri]|uniref:Non-structural maintenance of chromosomes element 1 homolog n=1 Tax=Cryomyces minteri TaxID=331657 RepID=A0A4U0WKL6_9PEZI|nr:hypothetical protein B0A49_10048 [Cryomyces minteri]